MVTVKYYGHSSFELKNENARILTDPFYYSTGQKRNYDPVKPEGRFDYILVSHDHFDHCDTQLIDELYVKGTTIIANRPASHKIKHPCVVLMPAEDGIVANAFSETTPELGDTYKQGEVNIRATYAEHPQAREAIGFYISMPEEIYFAGDTYKFLNIGEIKPPLLAMLPIGGKYTMDVSEAVEAAALIRPSNIVPMHYNTWDEIKADTASFKKKIRVGTMGAKVHVLKPGDSITLTSATVRPPL